MALLDIKDGPFNGGGEFLQVHSQFSIHVLEFILAVLLELGGQNANLSLDLD